MKTVTLLGIAALALALGASAVSAADVKGTGWVEQATDAANAALVEAFPPTTDPDVAARFASLLRIPDTDTVTIAPWVSTEPVSNGTVRKIGYGKSETVTVVTTDTGTYSSDGMADPHVLYPGVSVERGETDTIGGFFLALVQGRWQPFTASQAGSFTVYGSGNGVHYRTDGVDTCIGGNGFYGCL